MPTVSTQSPAAPKQPDDSTRDERRPRFLIVPLLLPYIDGRILIPLCSRLPLPQPSLTLVALLPQRATPLRTLFRGFLWLMTYLWASPEATAWFIGRCSRKPHAWYDPDQPFVRDE